MADNDSIKTAGHQVHGLGFLRGRFLQILVWPLLCLILTAALWYWTNSKIDAEKRALESNALADTSELCKDYAQYLTQAFQHVNQISLQLQYHWEKSHGNPNLQEFSQSGIFPSAQIVSVLVLNRQGIPVTATSPIPRKISMADRDYFIFHKNDDSNALLIGKPMLGRLSDKAIIPFSRRLNTAHGAFDGVAVISFAPAYLTSFYAGSFPGKTGLLAVAGLDGTLRSVKIGNDPDPASAALRAVPLFDMPEGVSYLNEVPWAGDKLARIVAWKTLKDYPLVAMVGIPAQDYLAPSQKIWATYRKEAALGSLLLLLFASMAAAMSARLARRKYQEEEVRKAYRIATEGGNEGFYMYEALYGKNGAITDFVIVDCNARGAEFYGVPQTQLLQTKLSSLYAGPYFDELMKMFRSAMESGFYETEFKPPQESKVKIEWVRSRLVRSGSGVAVAMQDITERKQDETNLRIAATAFESQEGMMITDTNNVVLRVNKAFTEETGYTAEEIVGQTPRLLRSGRHDAGFYRAMWETILRTGAWQGEIWDRRKNGEIYPKWLSITAVKGNDGAVTHYVGTHVDITERKSAEKEIQLLAYYDSLTRLPNRRLLMDRLQQALASSARIGREGALLLIDLDNFKTLNDTLGHQVGDLLLQQVAQRLMSCVREGDSVARLGGDEFVVLLEGLSAQAFEAAAQTETIGEKILTALKQPYRLDTYEHRCTSSIGVILFKDNRQTADELMKQADIAMYQAKKAGRNTLRFFDPQMQENISARVLLEHELHTALEKQQFHLHYQIQVNNFNLPLGAEALIRWIHPDRGQVSPAKFIPLAEETGLILPIGKWVLETACARIRIWQQEALTRGLVLAVNVSAKQFRQADFVAQVQAAVQRHDINPALLKLELTESMLLENIEDTITTMSSLNEIGVQFSLDDFGTGYSSLQYLKRLPLDQIKIDQSFVRNLVTDSNDMAIVRTIVAMARSLDMDVIAEGVETEEQQQLLLKQGCSNYQGYLFGRPVPVEQFEALLKQR